MNNVIEFRIQNGTISGHAILADGHTLYLGSERLATDPDDQDLTGALRQFNLSTAVAPSEWPNAHEGVTTDEDPRHHGSGCAYGCDEFVCEDDLCLACAFDRSGLWLNPYGYS